MMYGSAYLYSMPDESTIQSLQYKSFSPWISMMPPPQRQQSMQSGYRRGTWSGRGGEGGGAVFKNLALAPFGLLGDDEAGNRDVGRAKGWVESSEGGGLVARRDWWRDEHRRYDYER
jgi:hypothetical protein